MVTLNKESKEKETAERLKDEKKAETATITQNSKLKFASTVALWALTVFMFASGIVFIPSVASVIMILFAAVTAPDKRVQEFWRSKGLTKPLKIVFLLVLFALSVYLAPTRQQ